MNEKNETALNIRYDAIHSILDKLQNKIYALRSERVMNNKTFPQCGIIYRAQYEMVLLLLDLRYHSRPSKDAEILNLMEFVQSILCQNPNANLFWCDQAVLELLRDELEVVRANIHDWVNILGRDFRG